MHNLDLSRVDDEYFKLFFSLSPDLFAISQNDGFFKHLNGAWESVLGYSIEELMQFPYTHFLHPEDSAKTQALSEKFLTTNSIQGFENRFRCKDGSYRHFSWNAMKHSTQNLIFSVARDITHQKTIEARLKNQKRDAELQTENIHMLLSQVPALAAVTKGADHVFAFANSEYCALLGNRSPVGIPVKDALPGLSDQIITVLDHVYKTGEKYTAENLPMTADWSGTGQMTERCFTFIYSPLKTSAGETYGIWCLAFDVTEIKIMQDRLEISEKMASLGTVAAGVAHEINNPLAYVSGLLELLTRELEGLTSENANAHKKALLERIHNCGQGLERITKIVKSLKAFSRTDEETTEPVDIEEVLRTTLQFAESEVKHRAKVILDIAPVQKCFGNQSKLIQVFLNLVVNAAQAIPIGRVDTNSIVVSAKSRGKNAVEISVTDTGCGIPAQSLSKIFDPFYTSKPVGEGTGLGLSICHGIITSMKGTIKVESKVGVGSTFKVTLPSFEASEELIKPTTSSPSSLAAMASVPVQIEPQSILIIDDEVAFAEVLGLCLESDFEVTVVNSVHDALIEIANRKRFDVILCDLMMPHQTGMDLYYNLSRNYPGLQERMLFMTGGVFTTEANDFLMKVKSQKINKPFPMQDLRDLVLRTFQQSTSAA